VSSDVPSSSTIKPHRPRPSTTEWLRGAQSAAFHYISCAPYKEWDQTRKRKRHAQRAKKEHDERKALDPDEYHHLPGGYTNPAWEAEIQAEPQLPADRGIWKKYVAVSRLVKKTNSWNGNTIPIRGKTKVRDFIKSPSLLLKENTKSPSLKAVRGLANSVPLQGMDSPTIAGSIRGKQEGITIPREATPTSTGTTQQGEFSNFNRFHYDELSGIIMPMPGLWKSRKVQWLKEEAPTQQDIYRIGMEETNADRGRNGRSRSSTGTTVAVTDNPQHSKTRLSTILSSGG